MKAICYKCNHSWNFKGKIKENQRYITCSRCYLKIRVDRSIDFSKEETQESLINLPKAPVVKRELPTTYYLPPSINFIEVEDGIFVEKKIAKQFKDAQEETEPNLFQEQEQEIIMEIGSNLCKEHNLPASYDSYEKKWLCNECIKINVPNAKPRTDHLGTVSEVKNNQEIRIIPYDPVKHLGHMKNFF